MAISFKADDSLFIAYAGIPEPEAGSEVIFRSGAPSFQSHQGVYTVDHVIGDKVRLSEAIGEEFNLTDLILVSIKSVICLLRIKVTRLDRYNISDVVRLMRAVAGMITKAEITAASTADATTLEELPWLSLSNYKKKLAVGQSFDLTAEVFPDNINQGVTWDSFGLSGSVTMTTINKGRKITAKRPGITTIRVTPQAVDVPYRDCKLEVSGVEVMDIGSATQCTSKNIGVGESFNVLANVQILKEGNKSVSWSSSDDSVATVVNYTDSHGTTFDFEGQITGNTPGYSEIRVIPVKFPEYEAVVNVHVRQYIVLAETEKVMNLDDQKVLWATPLYMDDHRLTWTSSDPNIVEVIWTSEGCCGLRARTKGTATITCRSLADPNKFNTCKVDVVIPLDSVKISESFKDVSTSEWFNLSAAVLPMNPGNREVEWFSDNVRAVEVMWTNGGSCGLRAKEQGEAVITVRSKLDPNVYDTCFVTVSIPLDSVTISESSKEVNTSEFFNLSATVLPMNPDNREVEWFSDNVRAVEIMWTNGGSCGLRAKEEGEAVITVRSKLDPNVYDTCFVTVSIPLDSVTMTEPSKTVNVGDWFNLSAEVLPMNPDNRGLEWNSDNLNVVEIAWTSNGTCGLHAKEPGEAVITVRSTIDPNMSAACVVTVSS